MNSRSTRGFWSLFFTQFQESFSDNAYKFLVIFFVTAMTLPGDRRHLLVLLVGWLFSLPFILFSMAGGYLADRFSKRSVVIGVKIAEIPVMGVALLGLALKSLPILLLAVFIRSTQSACFSPSKYGLLPELLPEKRLSWGNGLIELGTFLAIIAGTVAGGAMYGTFHQQPAWAGVILIGLTAAGLMASTGIDRVPAADVSKRLRFNFLGDLVAQIGLVRKDRTLWLAVLGNTYFFFLAALLQFNIVFYAADVLKISETQSSYLQGAVAIGIGIGSLAAGYLSGNKIEYGLIPLGALGITGFGAMLSRAGLSFNAIGLNLGLLGFSAGFFAVPINAIIQHRPDAGNKGAVIAASNVLSSAGIFLASGAYYAMAGVAHLSPSSIFLASSLLTLVTTVYALILMPDSLLRLLLWFLVHSLYRIRVVGRDHIPAKGGALFVSNHLSFVDALLLMASTQRRIRFLIFKDFYDHPAIHPFAAIIGAIPISSELRPREMIRSLRAASDTIKSGHVVCIFAEGQITRTGQMLPFRRGLERIMKGVDAPIIPVHLDGVWGSIFSYEKGRFLWKLPKRIPYPVTVSYGAPMLPASTAFEVRQAVQELQTEAYRYRKQRMRTLPRSFVQTARRRPFRFAMADGQSTLRFGSALTRTIFLAQRLKTVWQGQQMVGILLPPSMAGALVNFAALLLGKVPVNLNYTLSSEAIAACARQCGIQTVVTSKAFLERFPGAAPGKTILIEQLAGEPGVAGKLMAALMAWTLPAVLLERALRGKQEVRLDDVATIIFSSGSTGDPKGVMLTHYNIGSNVAQLEQCFALKRDDRILGVLPFFHSFGFTATMALPLTAGAGVVYHANPLDAKTIGGLVRQHAVTFLVATPTFLQAYMRRCEPEQFGSLRFVLAGAEKLQDRTALSFEDKFGIRPLEAYGCTECSPAVTVNTRDYRAAGFRQAGSKRGKIGHPLPGVSVRIVDPETFRPLPAGQPGLLLVRGPNVMKGYLGRPEKTAEVIRDDWYVTGDIAALDGDGFIEIIDRLSRFSKIGGEMVPHIKVEEALQELSGGSDRVFAVTSGPDEKKGERLLVLHTLAEDRLKTCLDGLARLHLPNLWIPRHDAFFRVDALPYLGSGKLDLRKIRDLALQLSRA